MPMNLTVTRNRKTSHNYNSEGHGISLTVELDQSLLNQPDDLQRQIDRLYKEADAALHHQANGNGQAPSETNQSTGKGNGRPVTPATDAQKRAIDASIA